MKINWILGLGLGMSLLMVACGGQVDNGDAIIIHERAADGGLRVIKDSLSAFSFVNQEGDTVSNETLAGKIYVTDFFFTRCPSICPKMSQQMLRIHDKYIDNDKIVLLSHSIDTRGDSIPVLKKYAEKLDVQAPKWHFVTGEHDLIYQMAAEYMIAANVDENAPGGYEHSGMFVMVDGAGKIRGYCNGVDEEAVTVFLKDIDLLLDEN